MHPRKYYYGFILDRTREYTFRFDGGRITVEAYNEDEARILAQAQAIEKGWDYEILPDTMTLEEVKELVDKHINEIFKECQDINDCSGDIEPIDAIKLANITNELVNLIHKIYSNN